VQHVLIVHKVHFISMFYCTGTTVMVRCILILSHISPHQYDVHVFLNIFFAILDTSVALMFIYCVYKPVVVKLMNSVVTCETWGSHSGEDVDVDLLCCNAVIFWRRRQYVPPKRWYLTSSPHDVTTHKANMDNTETALHSHKFCCWQSLYRAQIWHCEQTNCVMLNI
jgi:hypothetical protein